MEILKRSIVLNNTKTKVNYIFYSLLIFADFLFYLTSACLQSSKNASWISILISTLILSAMIYLINFVFKKIQINKELVSYKVYLLLLALLCCVKAGLFIATASVNIGKYFYTQSPKEFILLLLCAGIYFCLVSSKRAVVTAGGFTATFVLAVVLLMIITASKDFKFFRLYPIFGSGTVKNYISFPFIYSAGNIMFFYRDNQSTKLFLPLLYAGLLGAVLLLGIILIIPYPLLGESFQDAVYQLSSLASLGLIFKKFEIALLACWVLCALAVGGYMAYTSLDCIGEVLKLKDKKGIAGMHIIVAYALANMFLKIDTQKLYNYISVIFFCFVLLCFSVKAFYGIINLKGGNKNE